MTPAHRLDRQEHSLDALLAALGLTCAPPDDDPRVTALAARHPHYPQYHRIGHKRQTAYRALAADRALTRAHEREVLTALVHDDDPSSPRWLAAALVTAVGARRLQEHLLTVLATGTPYERACAAGAWHWADADPGDPRYRAAITRSGE
ncbi:hypothetical protein [Kitasatospora sp. NBC_01539]|uniref:hypothetical protein n=1 Tax=Kitasatospora sp. NBC_01539 TaxID=2903577 RepID=UPI0038602CB4